MSTEIKNVLPTVLKGAGIVLSGLIVGNIIGMANQILLARYLGPNNYGTLNLAISVISIIGTVCSFGLVGALPTCIPRYYEKNQDKIVKSLITFSIKFVFTTCVIVSIILWAISGEISSKVFHENSLENILRIFAPALPFLILPNILQAILRGFQSAKHKVLIYDIGMPLSKIIIFVPFIFVGNELFGAVTAYISGYILVCFVSLTIIQTKLFPFIHRNHEKISVGHKLLHFSLPLALTGATFILISKTDIIMLGHYMSSTDVGIYTATLNIAGILSFVGKSFEWIFLPMISKYFAMNKYEDLESLFKSSSKWMFIVVTPLFLFVILFSKEIILFLFGIEYIRGTIPLIILTCGLSMNVITGLTGSMLVGSKHTKLNLLAEIIGGITNICLNILLIPIYGLEGAAIGTSASYFTRNCSSLLFVYRTSKMHPFKRNHIVFVLTMSITLLMLYNIKNSINCIFSWWEYTALLSSSIIGVYLTLITYSGILDNNDKFILKGILKKIRNR